MIDYTCSKCRTPLASPRAMMGQLDECPVCRTKNIVPDAPASGAPGRKRSWVLTISVLAGVLLLVVVLVGAGLVYSLGFGSPDKFTIQVTPTQLEEVLVSKEGAKAYFSTKHTFTDPVELKQTREQDKYEIKAMVASVDRNMKPIVYNLPFGKGTVYKLYGRVKFFDHVFTAAGSEPLVFVVKEPKMFSSSRQFVHIGGSGTVVTNDGTEVPLDGSVAARAAMEGYVAPKEAMRYAKNNMRSISQATMIYANENSGEYPPDLVALMRKAIVDPKCFLDPRLNTTPMVTSGALADVKQTDLESHCDFYYAGAGEPNNSDAGAILLYDKGRAGSERLVGFGDAHCEVYKAGSMELRAVVQTANALRKSGTKLPEDLMGPPSGKSISVTKGRPEVQKPDVSTPKPSGTKSVAEIRSLAEQGDADSQFSLGIFYSTGNGVSQDDTVAVMWYRKAADQGHALAQYNLACIYENGQGVAKDSKSAFGWLLLSAASGNKQAAALLSQTEALLSPGQALEARDWAKAWKPVTAKSATGRDFLVPEMGDPRQE
ncbi:MAG: tetratricopeptide repeat protein [Phycisphaerae bacterium]